MFPQHRDRNAARTGARTGAGHPLERGAPILAVIWAAGVLIFALLSPPAGGTTFLTIAMTLLVGLLPLALVWLALVTLGTLRELRAETAALQAAVEALHAPAPAPGQGTTGMPPATGQARDPLGAGRIGPWPGTPRPAAATTAGRPPSAGPPPGNPATPRPAPATPDAREAAAPDEPALALGAPDERPASPLPAADFIRALQFPDSAEDAEGVRALRLALEDRELARLIRAAQDVLTLLSQEGIYMDDLAPGGAQADRWRLFAAGTRGEAIASVGAIHDPAPLAQTAARMREDAIFRDAAHHFLRAFDRSFQNFEKSATDAEVVDLAGTRTARAFMLCGRVAGVFD